MKTTHDKHANDSHISKIKEYLLSGKSLTKLQALKMFGCWNTGDVIFKLRKEMDIKTEMIEENGKRFAKYYLNN